MNSKLEDALRAAIAAQVERGATIHSLAVAAELDWAQLRRFIDGQRELRSGAMGRLADSLNLELRRVRKR